MSVQNMFCLLRCEGMLIPAQFCDQTDSLSDVSHVYINDCIIYTLTFSELNTTLTFSELNTSAFSCDLHQGVHVETETYNNMIALIRNETLIASWNHYLQHISQTESLGVLGSICATSLNVYTENKVCSFIVFEIKMELQFLHSVK